MTHLELWIPGPTEVSAPVLAAAASPAIGHRTKEMCALYDALVPGCREMFGCERGVVLFGTHSATGFMEAFTRNGIARRALHIVNGAFAERWKLISDACEKSNAVLEIPWGRAATPQELDAFLDRDRDFDAVALVHNETSTGALAPLEQLAAVVRRRLPDAMLLVDAVTSAAATPIRFDDWGLDGVFTGSQKALALPPGLALAAVSKRLLEKAQALPGRGYYFDLVDLAKNGAKSQTPTTPALPQLNALKVQLERIAASGGFAARYARHAALAARTRAYCEERGFPSFTAPEFLSPTVACRENGGLDVAAWVKGLRAKGYLMSEGYGDLKARTFRIGHMGDHELAGLERLLAASDAVLRDLGWKR